MCKWSDLKDGTLNLDDVLDMHMSLNLKEYLEKESAKAFEEKNGE